MSKIALSRFASWIEGKLSKDTLLITSLGDSCAAVALGHERTLALDAMGVALGLGIGVAMTSTLDVLVLETDGSILLDLSALAAYAEASRRLANFRLAIIDNESYQSAGKFPRPCHTLNWITLCKAFDLECEVLSSVEALDGMGGMSDWTAVTVFKVDEPDIAVDPLPLNGRARASRIRGQLEQAGIAYPRPATKN